MRKRISGVVGILFGGLILISFLLRGGPQGEGAYRAGQITGLLFGTVLLGGGVFYLVQGIRQTDRAPRKRKRPKRRPGDEGEE